MRPRDWFSVGIRLLGAWLYYQALDYFMFCLGWYLEITQSSRLGPEDEIKSITYNFMHGAAVFALGTYFLFRAENLTRWAFKEPQVDADDTAAVSP
jgi:hypothetical protein